MSRVVSVAVATVLFLLVVAAVTGLGWGVVFFGLVAAGVAFGAIGIVGAVRRAGRAPVEWPDAWVGVATVTRLRSTTELKDGRRLITMDVRVEPADGSAPFDSVFTRRVAADAVPGVQPGLQFPAMWRQYRRERVKIARGRSGRRRSAFSTRSGCVTGSSTGSIWRPSAAACRRRPRSCGWTARAAR